MNELTTENAQMAPLRVEWEIFQIHCTNYDHRHPGIIENGSVWVNPNEEIRLSDLVELGNSGIGEVHIRVPDSIQNCLIPDQNSAEFWREILY